MPCHLQSSAWQMSTRMMLWCIDFCGVWMDGVVHWKAIDGRSPLMSHGQENLSSCLLRLNVV